MKTFFYFILRWNENQFVYFLHLHNNDIYGYDEQHDTSTSPNKNKGPTNYSLYKHHFPHFSSFVSHFTSSRSFYAESESLIHFRFWCSSLIHQTCSSLIHQMCSSFIPHTLTREFIVFSHNSRSVIDSNALMIHLFWI